MAQEFESFKDLGKAWQPSGTERGGTNQTEQTKYLKRAQQAAEIEFSNIHKKLRYGSNSLTEHEREGLLAHSQLRARQAKLNTLMQELADDPSDTDKVSQIQSAVEFIEEKQQVVEGALKTAEEQSTVETKSTETPEPSETKKREWAEEQWYTTPQTLQNEESAAEFERLNSKREAGKSKFELRLAKLESTYGKDTLAAFPQYQNLQNQIKKLESLQKSDNWSEEKDLGKHLRKTANTNIKKLFAELERQAKEAAEKKPEADVVTTEAESIKDGGDTSEAPFQLTPDMQVAPDTQAAESTPVADVTLQNEDGHEALLPMHEVRHEYKHAKENYYNLLERVHAQPENAQSLLEELQAAEATFRDVRKKRADMVLQTIKSHKERLADTALKRHPLHRDKPESLQEGVVRARMTNALVIAAAQERLKYEKQKLSQEKRGVFTALKSGLSKTGSWASEHKVAVGVGLTVVTLGAYAARKAVVKGVEATGGAMAGKTAASVLSFAALGGVVGGAIGRGVGTLEAKRRTVASNKARESAKANFTSDTMDNLEKSVFTTGVSELKSERFKKRATVGGAVLGAAVGAFAAPDTADQALEDLDELTDTIDYEGQRVAGEASKSSTQDQHPPQYEAQPEETPESEVRNESAARDEDVTESQEQGAAATVESVGNIGKLDSDGFQDREPGTEIPSLDNPAAIDTTPDVQNLVPNPEQRVTIPETGRIDTLSETFYQKYCDGELVGLPADMSEAEFKTKMWAAFHALDNNEAVMERMDLPNKLSTIGDVDKVMKGQSVNVAPLIEHMNGQSVEDIETGLYAPEDALAREGATPRETTPETSPRPEPRPENVTATEEAPETSIHPEPKPELSTSADVELDPKSAEYQASVPDVPPQTETVTSVSGNFEAQAASLYGEVFGNTVAVPDSYKLALQTELAEWVQEHNVTTSPEQIEHIKAMMIRDHLIMERFDHTRLTEGQNYLVAYDAHGSDIDRQIRHVADLPTQPYLEADFNMPSGLLAGAEENTPFGQSLVQLIKEGKVDMKNGELLFPTVNN